MIHVNTIYGNCTSTTGLTYSNDQGQYHREDGPAIEYMDGTGEYYLDGQKYSESEYKLIQFFKTPGCAL